MNMKVYKIENITFNFHYIILMSFINQNLINYIINVSFYLDLELEWGQHKKWQESSIIHLFLIIVSKSSRLLRVVIQPGILSWLKIMKVYKKIKYVNLHVTHLIMKTSIL